MCELHAQVLGEGCAGFLHPVFTWGRPSRMVCVNVHACVRTRDGHRGFTQERGSAYSLGW